MELLLLTIDGTPASSNSVKHYIQYNFSGIQPVRSEYTVNVEAEGAKTSIPSQTVNFRGKATKPTEFIYNEDNILENVYMIIIIQNKKVIYMMKAL